MSRYMPASESNSKHATNNSKMSIDASTERDGDAAPHDADNQGDMDEDSLSDFDIKKSAR